MQDKKFDTKNLEKLNNPERLNDIPPEHIWKKLELRGPRVLIDIGAGTGFFSRAFAEYVPDGKIYACDISAVMITWMEHNIPRSYSNIIPQKMDEHTVPLEDGSADLVYMINLHHELDFPEKMLEEAFRLLKSTGKIFIVDWKKVEMPQGPPANIRYTPETVAGQLKDAGFRNTAVYTELKKHFLVVAEK